MPLWIDLRFPRSVLQKAGWDPASRQLGTTNSELFKEVSGRIVLSCGPERPRHCAIFLDQVAPPTPGAKWIGDAFRFGPEVNVNVGELELATVTSFSKKISVKNFEQDTLIIAGGQECRPTSWPLPDFTRMVPGIRQHESWPPTGDPYRSCKNWLAGFSRKSRLPEFNSQSGEFEFAWGIVAGVIRKNRQLTVRSIDLNLGVGCDLFFSPTVKNLVSEFFRGDLESGRVSKVLCSFPTPAVAEWMFYSFGDANLMESNFVATEFHNGWAPSLTLLRFLCDESAPSKLVIMSDLNRMELLEFK